MNMNIICFSPYQEGAVNILLRVRNEATDEATKSLTREILTTLGYMDPVPGPGIRVLSIDGGGIRYRHFLLILVLFSKKKFEKAIIFALQFLQGSSCY